MSVNTSHTPDGQGVLIYNGEMILLYTKQVSLSFDKHGDPAFRGNKKGALYLTSHRLIFNSSETRDTLKSFSMPFHCLRDVKLEQPVFGANYLNGTVLAQPGANFVGQVVFKLTFSQGGCIDFGKAMLRAADLATRFRPYNAPPPYAPPPGGYFSPPPSYYTPPAQTYNGFEPPRAAFPDMPQPNNVYMYEQPPPYEGIGPCQPPAPYPAGSTPYGVPPMNQYPPPGNAGVPTNYPPPVGVPPNYPPPVAYPSAPMPPPPPPSNQGPPSYYDATRG